MNSRSQVARLLTALASVSISSAAFGVNLSDKGSPLGTTTYYQIWQGSTKKVSSSYAPDRKLSDGSSTFWAYCIDPLTSADWTQTYSTTTLDDFLNGTTTSGYASEIGRTGYSGYGLSNSSAAQQRVLSDLKELFSWAYNDSQTTSTKAAAFGMAVWEIVMQDGGLNADPTPTTYSSGSTGGRVRTAGSDSSFNNDAIETATGNYLTALNSNNWTTLLGSGAAQTNWTYTVYYDPTSPFTQNFIKVTAPSTPSTPSAPEPGSLALVGLALTGAYQARRRLGRPMAS